MTAEHVYERGDEANRAGTTRRATPRRTADYRPVHQDAGRRSRSRTEDGADRHDIDVADVYRAFTYYHDHPEEMRAVERQREAAVKDHEHLTTDPDDIRG